MEFLPITEKDYNQKVEEEISELYLNNISYLTLEDLEKPNIEDYQRVFRCLTGDNYYTYMFYLQAVTSSVPANPPAKEEIEFYKNVIKDLFNEEQSKYKRMIEEKCN